MRLPASFDIPAFPRHLQTKLDNKEPCQRNPKDRLHSERIPLFWQIKYIFNIDTMWILCGKMLIPLSYDRHFHACRVKVDKEWTLLKPGDEMDFQANDTYSVDDNLYVTVRHCV